MSVVPPRRKSLDAPGASLLLVLCLCWSLQQIAVKVAAPDITPALQIVLRSLLTSLALGALVLRREGWRAFGDGTLVPGLLAGLLCAGEFLLMSQAVLYTTAGHSIAFIYTSPIFAALGLHFLVPEEHMSGRQWCGVALAFAGIVLAFLGKRGAAPDAGNMLLGDLFSLAAGALWGFTTVVIRGSSLSDAAPDKTLFYQMLVTSLAATALYLAGGAPRPVWSTAALLSLAYLTLIVSLWSFLMWFWMMRRYLATQMSAMSFLAPIVGVIFGALLLDEPLEANFVGGSLLALAGILVVTRTRGAAPKAAAAD
ncbi:MAG TPA: DMT family transporter [Bordetella sp.]